MKKFMHKYLLSIIFYGLIAVVIATIFCRLNSDHTAYVEWLENREVIEVYVGLGDCLDQFCSQYKPSWMDIREYREYILDLNDMSNSMLYAGQTLKLYK